MSEPKMTAEERVREYEVTLFRSNQPRMDGTSNYAPTRAVTKSHARIIAEAHAAAAVDEVRTRAEKAEARVAELEAAVAEASLIEQIADEALAKVAELGAEVERLREIEHAAWHLCRDGFVAFDAGQKWPRGFVEPDDLERLGALLPDECPQSTITDDATLAPKQEGG